MDPKIFFLESQYTPHHSTTHPISPLFAFLQHQEMIRALEEKQRNLGDMIAGGNKWSQVIIATLDKYLNRPAVRAVSQSFQSWQNKYTISVQPALVAQYVCSQHHKSLPTDRIWKGIPFWTTSTIYRRPWHYRIHCGPCEVENSVRR